MTLKEIILNFGIISLLSGCATPEVKINVQNSLEKRTVCLSNLNRDANYCQELRHYFRQDCKDIVDVNDKLDPRPCYDLAEEKISQCQEKAKKDYGFCLQY